MRVLLLWVGTEAVMLGNCVLRDRGWSVGGMEGGLGEIVFG